MKKLIALLLVLLMVFSLVACGQKEETPAAQEESKTETPKEEAKEETKEESDEASSTSSKDTINLVLNQVIETINPWDKDLLVGNQLMYQCYDTLFFYTDAGEFEPRLAESYTVSEDGTLYTFKLRDDVVFHNGAPMTAEDVAWSLNYEYRDGPYTTRRNNVSGFVDARVVDDTTVEVEIASSDSTFLPFVSQYGFILCEAEFMAAEEAGIVGTEWVPFGTGPYVITSFNPDAMITLEAFPDYYRGEARIKNINYQVLLDNNTITIAFEAGDLDFISVPTASWNNISSNSNYTTYLSPTNHVSWFMINTHEGPLGNKLVRQALSYGMDREAMCVIAYDGLAQPAYTYFNADTVFGALTVEEMEAAGINTFQYNPEKAKELLAEAGYADGLDLGTLYCINSSYWEKMSTVFQDNMRDIGVTVNIELADSSTCRSHRFDLDYDLCTSGNNMTPDVSAILYSHRYVTEEDIAAGNQTELRLQNMELDQLLRDTIALSDRDAQEANYLEAIRIMQEEVYCLPTFHKSIPYAYYNDLVCEEINTNYYHVYNFYWK